MEDSEPPPQEITVFQDGVTVSKSDRDRIIASVRGTLVRCNTADAKLRIVLGDDRLLESLNRRYAGGDQPTDVLAFNLTNGDSPALEGEIYISVEYAGRSSAERGEPPLWELCRLAVHGALHLCGWDHPNARALRKMMDAGDDIVSSVLERR